MKTTIELPDALAHEAKEYAREHGTSLRELVIEGLRTSLHADVVSPQEPFAMVTFKGEGLCPGVGPEDWTELGYGLS